MKFTVLISLVLLTSLGLVSPTDAGEKEDESEILYAQGRIAALEGKGERALELAIQAFRLNALNLKAGELLLESARGLKRSDILAVYSPQVGAAKKRRARSELVGRQLEIAQKEIRAGKLELASRRLLYVESQTGALGENGAEVIGEARLRLGMGYLETLETELALSNLRSAGKEFGQQAAFLTGNLFSQRGYPGEAVGAYLSAAERNWPNFNAPLAETSSRAAAALNTFSLSLQGYLSQSSDSNPFGLPEGQLTLTGGTENRALLTTAGAFAAMRSPLIFSRRVSIQLETSLAQQRSLSRDVRTLLDSQSFAPGLVAIYSHYGFGRLSLRYGYSYQRTPVADELGGYELFTLQRAHELGFFFSRALGSKTDLTLSYRLRSAHFVSAGDEGAYDRSGVSHSAYLIISRRTPWRLLYPSFSLGYLSSHALGEVNTFGLTSATLSNSARIGSTALEMDLSAGYDQGLYPFFPGGRLDRSSRFGISLAYPLVPRRLTLSSQISNQRSLSTQPYYQQSRFSWVTSLVFSAI